MSAELDRDLVPVDAMLRGVATAFDYPPTPGLSVSVRAALSARRGRAEGRRLNLPWPRLKPALTAAFALVAVAFGVALVMPGSRSALADLFNIGNVRIADAPTGAPPPPALAPGSFARPSSLDDARASVDFALRLPAVDEERLVPDEVYVHGEAAALPVVIAAYPQFDLYQTRLGTFGKGSGEEEFVETSFDGHNALWIEAGGHIAQFYDAEGRLVVESRRSVDRGTLLWAEDGITYRLETDLPMDGAIAVARSLQ